MFDGNANKRHYAWVIFAVCTMTFTATTGILQNTQGLYYQAVSKELSIPLSSFTVQSLFYGLGGALMLPWVNRILSRTQHIRLLCSLMLLLFCGSYFCMGFHSKVWMWCVSMFIMGVSSAFIGHAFLPFLINRWFAIKRSFVIGLATAISASVGMIVSPFGSKLIYTKGWRFGYFFFGLLALCISLPMVACFLRRDPKEKGVFPYGTQDSKQQFVWKNEFDIIIHLREGEKVVFILIICITILWATMHSFVHHLASFGTTIGLTPVACGVLTSCSYAGNAGGKVLLGFLNERFGVKKMTFVVLSLLMIAMMIMACFSLKKAFLYVAAVLCGLAMPLNVLQSPVLVWDMFDSKRYTAIYNIVAIGFTFVCAAGNTFLGWMYSKFGSYRYCFLFGLICMAISLLLVIVLYHYKGILSNKNDGIA